MAEYSPMMQHYLDMKQQYKDCVLFYRLGDFYEMFFDDAINVSHCAAGRYERRNFIFQYPLEAVLKIAEKRREVAA